MVVEEMSTKQVKDKWGKPEERKEDRRDKSVTLFKKNKNNHHRTRLTMNTYKRRSILHIQQHKEQSNNTNGTINATVLNFEITKVVPSQ